MTLRPSNIAKLAAVAAVAASFVAASTTINTTITNDGNDEPLNYGVDVTFPTHHWFVSTNYPSLPHNVDPSKHVISEEYVDMPIQPLGNKQEWYDHFLQGCRDYYGKRGHMCDSTEQDRVKMSIEQPLSMRNYTDTGFKKIRAPETLYKLLKDHWDKNQHLKKEEKWSVGNTYVNHWESPTYMASVEDVKLRGGGHLLKKRIWDAARPILEEWTGQKLKESSLYGIRAYTEGAVLAPHVDRNPLITSCIVNVAQDVDEDWPLEVIDRQGRAVNVTMKPGDMVLYESHSLIHARPFPLKGRFFANTFIHFEPIGINENNSDLPTYIVEGTPWAKKWWANNPDGKQHSPSVTTLQTVAHGAARDGDLDTLQELAQEGDESKSLLHKQDENGWQPLHEAVRAGHYDVVHYLVTQHGADINARTNNNKGGSPLWWAKNQHDEPHPVVDFLRDLGAVDIGPEL